MEHYNKPEPVNLGSGFEVKIRDLVEIIIEETGFKGRVVWDKTKPNGQPRRKLDVSRSQEEFGFAATVDLRSGLCDMIEWYRVQRELAPAL